MATPTARNGTNTTAPSHGPLLLLRHRSSLTPADDPLCQPRFEMPTQWKSIVRPVRSWSACSIRIVRSIRNSLSPIKDRLECPGRLLT
ncbi:hypothetical protein Y032_0873g2806 [Ancylostoma ceylanicum]|uniref:Uncharacterized protein n=1 Tax=Ancylostoma ceylanicum TaxID=53326 RepID=A0A016WAK7_9BILA|nr:hypothetical protein Y032_0873g2806 [Ancylostoma ceylanicum]